MNMDNESREVQVVAFRLENAEYGIEIGQVREIINLSEITPLPQANQTIEGVINLRGEIIPIINLKKRLNLANDTYPSEARVIVVESEKQLLGLKVDEAVEVLHLNKEAVQTLGDIFPQAEKRNLIVGVGKLEDRLIVLLDLARVLDHQEIQEIQKDIEEAQAQAVGAGKSEK